eukprot:GHVT01065883.1.p2 GENE.GHVT01065883.1~~GHVT01065883.1.p2  ORF type:complete len:104 (-),score=3.50 GHVT01065883.1:1010-1321(-)
MCTRSAAHARMRAPGVHVSETADLHSMFCWNTTQIHVDVVCRYDACSAEYATVLWSTNITRQMPHTVRVNAFSRRRLARIPRTGSTRCELCAQVLSNFAPLRR